MNDSTELAQRMKAAALNATGAHERLRVMPEGDLFDISLAEGTQLDADITALNSFHDEATPANVLALVEALEASQSENERMYKTLSERNGEPVEGLVKRVAELETYSKTTLEFREAALNENRHLKLELEIAEKRIEELEARTVKLPPTFWYEHDDLSRDIPVLDKRLVKKAIRAVGIQVIEGEQNNG